MIYVMVLDAWSNATFVGPFERMTDVDAYINKADMEHPDWSFQEMTEEEYLDNVAKFGPAPIQAP